MSDIIPFSIDCQLHQWIVEVHYDENVLFNQLTFNTYSWLRISSVYTYYESVSVTQLLPDFQAKIEMSHHMVLQSLTYEIVNPFCFIFSPKKPLIITYISRHLIVLW